MSSVIKLPGLVDVHVHLREPGNTQKEGFETGTKAALAGGYTTILDMPNNPDSIVTPEKLEEKIKLAKGRINCDVGFHFGGSEMAVPYFEKVGDKVWGLKVYMNHTTGNLLIENDKELDLIFSSWFKDKPLMVHAEGLTLKKAISLTKKYGNKLHICHVSLADEIDQIKKAKEEGLKISCEISCHHLFLTNEDLKILGSFGIMKPPLASKKDVKYLWKNLKVIDMVASDHAPHTKYEKLNSKKVPFGVPGLETTLPILLNATDEGRLSLERVVELTSTNPKKIFNLKNDTTTYVEVDLDEEYEIKNENLFTKCGWTPFNGLKVKGKVKKVVLRNKEVFSEKRFADPFGKVISPV